MNPDIANIGKETRFGQPNAPARGGEAAWSVRGALRRLQALDIDLNDEAEVRRALGGKPTNAQKVAIKQILKAQKDDADTRAAEFVTENVEGKLPQTTINAEFEEIKKSNDDELRSIIAAGLSRFETSRSSDSGSAAPGADAITTESAPEAGSAAGVSGAVDTPPA